jgi:hypothetical protein
MNAILVVVDQLSKLVKMAPTKTIMTTFNSAKLFFDVCIRHHEMPQFIMNNKDTKFTTGFWKHLFWKVGTNLPFSITFHPQTDGQTKRVNGVLNQYLKNYVNASQKDWGEHLSLVEFCYNFTMHLAIKMFSFKLTLGKETRKLMDLAIPMGRRDHSKEVVEMVKGQEDKYT